MNVFGLKRILTIFFFTIFDHFGLGIDACSTITRCLSLPKRDDKKRLKRHFLTPSQLHKIRFECQGIIFNEKRPKIFTNAYGQAGG